MKPRTKEILTLGASIAATVIVLSWATFTYAKQYNIHPEIALASAAAHVENFFNEIKNGIIPSNQTSSNSSINTTTPSSTELAVAAMSSSQSTAGTKQPAPIASIVLPIIPTSPTSTIIAAAKELPYVIAENGFANDSAWLENWGQEYVLGGSLIIGASPATTGGTTFLSGSNTWNNYSFDANVDWTAGEAFGMIARAYDPNNFVYCDFGGGSVGIVLHNGQTQTTLAAIPSKETVSGITGNFGVQAYGNDMACTEGGQVVVAAVLPNGDLSFGGVGFTSWDPTTGESSITVMSVDIAPLTSDTIVVPFPAAAEVSTSPGSTATTTAEQTTSIQLPYSETDFSNGPHWETSWGAMSHDTSNFMEVGANSSTTGGGSLLDGSSAWTDYIFSATVDWVKGQTFSLVTRYNSGDNEILCAFGNNGTVNIERSWNGQGQVIGQGTAPNLSTAHDLQVFAEVNGSHVTCGINGFVTASYLAPQLTSGGIGFDTWDPTINNSQIIVKAISVTPIQ